MYRKIFRGMLFAAITTMSLCLLGCEPKDADGNTYPTVKIGDQVWMAKNLNVNTEEGSWCYEHNPANCEKYGRLYTWRAALKACPSGWHLPSKEEFERLLDIAGGAYAEMRSINLRVRSWEKGSDKYGFSALPAGGYDGYGKEFVRLGYYALFWSTTIYNSDYAYALDISGNYAVVAYGGKGNGLSVRCLQD